MRLNRICCVVAGLIVAAALWSSISGQVVALEKKAAPTEEDVIVFPVLPEGADYTSYSVGQAPNGLPGPIVLPAGYAPAGYDPSCCQVPVCETVCPPSCQKCGTTPYVICFCNPVTCCKEYVEVCLPCCCDGCPTKHCRRAIFGHSVITFSWCCGYEVKIRVKKCGDLVVREKDKT